jgi:ubiquinone/menaquinone biosynthesis C-methylase UbiE
MVPGFADGGRDVGPRSRLDEGERLQPASRVGLTGLLGCGDMLSWANEGFWAVAVSGPASTYDSWYDTELGAAAHAVELAQIAELADPQPGERALDVGCGTGIYTAWLLGRGVEVAGVDRDAAMLAAAEAKAPSARLVQADAAALPFEPGVFDLALAVTLFSFLDPEQRVRAAAELVRVDRHGGRVVIADLARSSHWAADGRAGAAHPPGVGLGS